jgi:hypothetical protein
MIPTKHLPTFEEVGPAFLAQGVEAPRMCSGPNRDRSSRPTENLQKPSFRMNRGVRMLKMPPPLAPLRLDAIIRFADQRLVP